MSGYLRQSTASQLRTIGPFVDDTDFKTLENGLTIANTDIVTSKQGAADGTKNSGGATAHGAGGAYTLTWDATDTNTVGELFYSVKVAGALVVFGTYIVLEEAVYDALFAASAPGYVVDQPVNVTKVNGTSQTARDIGAAVPAAVPGATGGLFIAGTNAATTVTTSFTTTFTGNLTGSVASVTGQLTTGQIGDAVLDEVVEGSRTLRQMLRGYSAALLAKASGLATTTAVFRDIDDSKDRITATVDADGNRSAITLDLT